MHIRPANNTPEDINFILSRHQLIQRDHHGLSEDILKRDIFSDTPKAQVFMIEHDKQTAGFILLSFCYWAAVQQILWVSQIYIDEAERGRHFRKVGAWLKQFAKNNHCSHIVWGTSNEAARTLALWEKTGAKNLANGFSFWSMKP